MNYKTFTNVEISLARAKLNFETPITIDIIAYGTGLETDDVMRPTSVTGVRFFDSV